MLTVVWAIPAIAIAASLLITGPIYNALGISPNEKVEGLGVPVNQMARVVAYDGDMSESDKEYMSSLLPLEQYQEVYAPTCTDPLKWNAQFNPEPLTDGFWSHWLSMLVKIPSYILRHGKCKRLGTGQSIILPWSSIKATLTEACQEQLRTLEKPLH